MSGLQNAGGTEVRHKKICAWCQRQLQDGIEPASHGICAECKAIHFPHAP
jgi:hypothetical protein